MVVVRALPLQLLMAVALVTQRMGWPLSTAVLLLAVVAGIDVDGELLAPAMHMSAGGMVDGEGGDDVEVCGRSWR